MAVELAQAGERDRSPLFVEFGNGSDIAGDVKPMFADESARFATNALLAEYVLYTGDWSFW